MLLTQPDITKFWNISPYNIRRMTKDGTLKPRVATTQKKLFNYYDLIKVFGPPLKVTELIEELKKLQDKKEDQ